MNEFQNEYSNDKKMNKKKILNLQNPIPPNRTASSARKKFSSPCGLTDLFLFGGADDDDDDVVIFAAETFVTLLLFALVFPSLVEF